MWNVDIVDGVKEWSVTGPWLRSTSPRVATARPSSYNTNKHATRAILV